MTALTSQILQNRLVAICREGADTFRRMARSALVIHEGQYACAVLDASGRLLAQEQGEPSQLAAVRNTVRHLVDYFSFNIADGDILLVGDPYFGGTSGGCLTVVRPVQGGGDVAFFVAVRFAAVDLAGNVPGLLQPDAHEIWQESLRITPVKLNRGGNPQNDVLRYVLRNTRAPDCLRGDLAGAFAGTARVAGKIGALIETHGLAALGQAAEYGIAYARSRAIRSLDRLAATSGLGKASLVEDGIGSIEVVARTERCENGIRIDLSASSPTHERSANLTPSATLAVVVVQLFTDLLDEIAVNEGLFETVTIVSGEDQCINPAYPAAVSLGWRLVAPLLATALAEASGTGMAVLSAAAPTMVAFDTIGSSEQCIPIQLSPAYRPAAGIAGGDTLDGMRIIPSVEQLEAAGTFRLLSRELDDAGNIVAKVEIRRDGLEAILPPTGDVNRPIVQQDRILARARSNVLDLEAGALVTFTYVPRGSGGPNAIR